MNKFVRQLQAAIEFGSSFVFGYSSGANLPFIENEVGTSFIFIFKALPIILVVSAILSILIHFGILQKIVKFISFLSRKFAGLYGTVASAAVSNNFVGMIETLLLIKSYLKLFLRGGLFAMMTIELSTIAGRVYALYVSTLSIKIDDATSHFQALLY